MRLVIASFALALGAASAPAAAQSAGAGALAPNEILFEISVSGRARTRSNNVLVALNYIASGATAPAARAAAAALGDRLREIARGFGAENMPVQPSEALPGLGFVSEPSTTYVAGPDGDERPAGAAFFGNGAMRLRLREPQRFAELRAALEQAGAINIMGPINQLDDDTEARRSARLDALAKARAEADQFARSQTLRVVRMVRFSEVSDLQGEAMRIMMNQLSGRAAIPAGEVETSVTVQAGFALAPR